MSQSLMTTIVIRTAQNALYRKWDSLRLLDTHFIYEKHTTIINEVMLHIFICLYGGCIPAMLQDCTKHLQKRTPFAQHLNCYSDL